MCREENIRFLPCFGLDGTAVCDNIGDMMLVHEYIVTKCLRTYCRLRKWDALLFFEVVQNEDEL